MTLPLPTMNRICKHWNLPQEFQESCDYYFLRNYSDQDFVSLLQVVDTFLVIQEYGINFQVLFLGDAAKVYTKNGELAKRNEPNNTFYWCSFRSLTFEFNGKKETKSFVLVQVDKKGGIGEVRDQVAKMESTASGGAGAIHPQKSKLSLDSDSLLGYPTKEWEDHFTPSDKWPTSKNPRCNPLASHRVPGIPQVPKQATSGLSPKEAFHKNGFVSSADAIAEYERIQELKEDLDRAPVDDMERFEGEEE